MAILIDKRIQRFVEGYLWGENEDTIGIRLKDIDETFWFKDEISAQKFVNEQALERVYDKELRNNYFDYINEYGEIHRYYIKELSKGKIISFKEEVVDNKYIKK